MNFQGIDADLRDGLIKKRNNSVSNILVFTSGKGGVGKSTISAHAAYILSKDHDVGILDLDLHGPSIPFILKAGKMDMEESKNGLVPPKSGKVKIMSMEIFAGDKGLPFRGENKSDIIRDMYAITDFGKLDYLIVDTPPGTGDEFLTLLELFGKREKIIFISMPNNTSWNVTRRAINVAAAMHANILGVMGNMSKDLIGMEDRCGSLSVPYLGNIGYHPGIVDKSPSGITDAEYFDELGKVIEKIKQNEC